MKKRHFVMPVLLIVVVGAVYLARREASRPQDFQGTACDMSLWAHVYHGRFPAAQDRLEIVNPCLTVTGTIVNARPEADGDWHIQLELDAQFQSLLNEANLKRQQGYLVVEPVCSNRVTQRDTLEEGVCDGFSQAIFSPDFIGRRVAVTGVYVLDRQHGWMELHPVTSIAVIP